MLPSPRRLAAVGTRFDEIDPAFVIRDVNPATRQIVTEETPDPIPIPNHEISGIAVETSTNVDDLGNTDHLHPFNEAKKLSIIKEWEDELSTDKVQTVVCAACSKRIISSECRWVNGNTVDLALLSNPCLPDRLLPISYNTIAYKKAILNPKGLEHTTHVGHIRFCSACSRSLSERVMPKFAHSNWLYYGYEVLPEDVKSAFDQSTLFDRMLVSRARCNSITCQFNARQVDDSDAGQQNELRRARKGVRGNVMVSPLNVIKMNEVIPPASNSIRDTMCAIFVGNNVPSRATISKYRPILVRRSRVKTMIQFLIGSNLHYRPSDSFRFSEENLNNLFQGNADEGLPASAHIGYIPHNDAIDAATSDYTLWNVDGIMTTHDEDELLMENVGYTDGDDSPMSYHAMKSQALERCLQGKPFIVSGKGSEHLPDFYNPSILTWLFPQLDPWGIGGFYHPGRRIRIGMGEQLTHLLMIDNSPFERDPEFAFVFHNVCRKALVSRSLRFAVSQRQHRGIVDDLLSVDPEVLVFLNEKCQKNVQYRPESDSEKRAFKLLSSLRMISRHVPGSDGYKTMLRNEIRSLINFRGAPTLFITLNPSDVDHPIVRLLAGHEIQLEDITRGEDMSEWQRKLFAARNPASCARFFDLILRNFIRIILRYGRDTDGVYGKCSAYYATVEAQGKGTLHAHMLIWVEGHLSPQLLREKMSGSESYKDKVFAWLESIIKCEFPGPQTVDAQRMQYPQRILHREMGNPHPGVLPSPSISAYQNSSEFWNNFDRRLIDLLHQYAWHEHQPTCWKYLERGQEKNDENCRMGMNGETREKTEMDPETYSILLRRRHPKLAPYTDVVTFLLRCNMDIKFVGSGEAAKAFLYYVTDYITKPSLPVHVGMAALSYAVKQTHTRIPEGLNESSSSQQAGAVITAVNSMMGRQEISHAQVMSYLIGGGDHYKSEKFAILHWGAIRRFVQEQWTNIESTGSGAECDYDGSISLTLGDKTITASSQLLDYIYRSNCVDLENLCLYDFVSFAVKVRFSKDVEDAVDRPGSFISSEHPQQYTHYMRLRRLRHIPVILGPSIPNSTRSVELKEEWARDMLILFKPWRIPLHLKESGQSWTKAYESYSSNVSDLHKNIISNMGLLTECNEARDNHPRGRHRPESDCDINEESTIIESQDDSGVVHGFNLDEVYAFDPFSEIDSSEDTEGRVGEFCNILSDDVSRLLDMCLPVTADDLLQPAEVVVPSQVSSQDEIVLADYHSIMSNKRKRAVAVDNNDTEAHRTRRRLTSPIATRAVLSDPNFAEIRRRQEYQIAEDLTHEMSLVGNAEQLAAFNLVAHHIISRNEEQLLLHVAGVGGTGKSHLIKTIVMLFERLNRRSELLLGAPTGIAAVLIKGQTLHSLILVTPNGKSQDTACLSKIWGPISCFVLDEISMVGSRFFSLLSCRMRQGKGDDLRNSHKPFGGVNVIFMGDFAQLKPPKQFPLYSEALVKNPSFQESRNERGISAMNGAFLWRQIKTVVQLVQNKRQSEDPEYAAFLSRLRVGGCREKGAPPYFLNDLDYLKTRLLEYQSSNPTTVEEFRDAPIIVGSKTVRDVLNAKLVAYNARRSRSELRIYHSKDYISKKIVNGATQTILWNLPSAVNREAFGRLPMFIGMKVMITENLAFNDGIVNGTEGIIHDIKFEEDEQGRRYAIVAYVFVQGCGVRIGGLPDDVIPIFPTSTRIQHAPLMSTRVKSKNFRRNQLPLVPAYVYTDFKSQGRTLKRAIVDLATARGQGVYVMLSRVTSLSGILILRWFPPTKLYHRLPEELRSELARLQSLDITTL